MRQLHEEDGSPRPIAAVMSGIEYGVRTSFGALPGLGGAVEGLGPSGKPAGRIGSPRRRAFEELLALEEYDVRDFDARALQAELGGWLAIDALPVTERIAAVRMLGRVSREIGDVVPSAATAAVAAKAAGDSADDEASGVERLSELVVALSKAARSNNGAEVVRLLDPFAPMAQDRAAARRLLRATALLSHQASGATANTLRSAAEHYARQVCALALDEALADRRAEVRAEAHEHVLRLEPARAFDLATAAAERRDWLVLEAVFRELRAAGLPSGETSGPRFVAWLRLFVGHTSPDLTADFVGGLPAMACGCLERFAPGDVRGLRPEVWEAWLAAYAPTFDEQTEQPGVGS